MGGDSLATFEGNVRVALRAQSQCRATLETLAAIKNPPIVYARQANIAQGPQQVNNGVAPPSRAGENENVQNKLLEARNDKCLDTRAAGAAIGGDTALETVGALHRAKDARG